MTIRIKRITVGAALIFLAVLCVMLRSGSPYALAYQAPSLYIHVALSAALILYGITHRLRYNNFFLIAAMTLFCCSVLLTMFLTNELSAYRNYLLQIMMCIDAFFVVCILGVPKTVEYWVRVMRVVTIAAVLLWVLVSLLGVEMPILTTEEEKEYYTIFFASQLVDEERISGTFWEPSMFAVMLAFTMFFELMPNKRIQNYKKFVLIECIALVLVGSMSSLIYMVMLLYVVLYKRMKTGRAKVVFLSTVLIAGVLILLWFNPIIDYLYVQFPSFFYKFVERDSSYLTRLYNPVGDVLTCLNNPFGAGIVNVERIVSNYADVFAGKSGVILARTSTWSYYFAAFGVVAGIAVNAIWIMGFVRSKWLSASQKIVMIIMMTYALTSITLVNNQLYWILIIALYFSAYEEGFFQKTKQID